MKQISHFLTIDLFLLCRDLGEYIRKQVSDNFPQGEVTKVADVDKWNKFVFHLENISNNKSLNKYPRSFNSSATGLSVEECNKIISTDFLEYIKTQKY